jgi:hypothetical protein
VAEGQFEYPFEEYAWATTSAPNSDYAGLYDIRVTITWEDGNGPESYTASSSQYRSPPVVTRR